MPFRSPRAGDANAAVPRARTRLRLPALRRPSTYVAALLGVTGAVAFVAAITYFGAAAFSERAADDRASGEARSFAQHSGTTATGEAYAGYLQILRYADDPLVRTRATAAPAREAAMQQLLYLNTNRMEALAVVDRTGLVLARTDDSIAAVRESEAFQKTRAHLGPANSDIVLPEGAEPYVEYTAPLRDPDGTIWAFLYARVRPQRLWTATLAASVDGSRNVIINAEGRYAAGVPADLVGQPWRGVPLDGGAVRAHIAGAATICGLGAIGRNTQIDHGWNVASCLPASLVHAEANDAMGEQRLLTLAAAVLAVVLAGGVLRVLLAPQPDDATPTAALAPASIEGDGVVGAIAEPQVQETPAPEAAGPASELIEPAEADAGPASEIDPTKVESVPTPIVIAPDVDALALIDAYERRNAALAERLRETVQARLMLAMAHADEAFRLATSGDAEAAAEAASLHQRAVEEMEELRERDLRAIGQNLHPGVVRLGLPAALRTLRKDLAGRIDVNLDIDPASDRVGGGAIDAARRTLVYRIARDATDALAAGGAPSARVDIARDGDDLRLLIESPVRAFDLDALTAHTLAVHAYGGTLTAAVADSEVRIAVVLPAPIAETADESPGFTADAADESPYGDGAPDGETVAEIIDRARAEVPALVMSIAVDPADAGVVPPAGRASLLAALVRDAGHAFASAGAREIGLAVQPIDAELGITMRGEAPGAFDESAIAAVYEAIEEIGGFVAVSRRGDVVTVTAEVPVDATATSEAEDPAAEGQRPVVVVPAPPDARSFAASLRQAVDALDAPPTLTLDIDDDSLASAPTMPLGLDGALLRLVGDAAAALATAGAESVSIALRHNPPSTFVSLTSPSARAFDPASLAAHREAIEAAGAFFAIAQRDASVTVTVEVPAGLESPPAVVRLTPRPDAA